MRACWRKCLMASGPVRHEYRLTQKGLDLYPVMMSIVHWGDIHTAGKAGRPLAINSIPC
jgi:DNA-binding HxlR family transcriptional regulator